MLDNIQLLIIALIFIAMDQDRILVR